MTWQHYACIFGGFVLGWVAKVLVDYIIDVIKEWFSK